MGVRVSLMRPPSTSPALSSHQIILKHTSAGHANPTLAPAGPRSLYSTASSNLRWPQGLHRFIPTFDFIATNKRLIVFLSRSVHKHHTGRAYTRLS
jgi:hypothetical protein